MTISTTSAVGIGIGNGATTVFSFSFVADQVGDLSVYYTDANQNVTLLSPIQYTVLLTPVPTGGLWAVGGTVTYPLSGPAIANGTNITIVRSVPYTQEVSIQNQGAFYQQAVEQAIDIQCLEIQQLNYQLSRTLQVPIGSNLTPLQYLQAIIAAMIGSGGSSPFTGNISTVTALTYTIGATDVSLLFNAVGGAQTVTLPNPLTFQGRILNIKKIDATANAVSFVGSVDGSSSYSLNFQNQSVTLQANGTGWSVF